MIGGAHFDFAGVGLELHAFELVGDLLGIDRLGLLDRPGQHVHLVVDPQVVESEVLRRAAVFRVERIGELLSLVRLDVGVVLGDLLHLAFARGTNSGHHAQATEVIGIESCIQAGILGRLDQKSGIVTPVAANDHVGTGRLDLGDIGREILHLDDRVQVVAYDLNVGPLALEVRLGGTGDGMAEGIVLVDQVDLLDLRILGHVVGHGFHFHIAVGVETEMPEAALGVGEVRIHRGVVQVQDGLVRIALIVLVHCVDEHACDAGAIALGDDAYALVDHLLQHVQALLRAHLVVEGHDFDLRPAGEVALVDVVGDELELLQPCVADVGEPPGKRVDISDFERFSIGRSCKQGRYQKQSLRCAF